VRHPGYDASVGGEIIDIREIPGPGAGRVVMRPNPNVLRNTGSKSASPISDDQIMSSTACDAPT